MIDPGIEPGTFSGFIQLCERDVITTTPADLVVDVRRFGLSHDVGRLEMSGGPRVSPGPGVINLPNLVLLCLLKNESVAKAT